MKKFRITLTSSLLALLSMANVASAQEQACVNNLIAKGKKHHHSASDSDSSDSDHGKKGRRGKRGHRGETGRIGAPGNDGASMPGTPGPAGGPGAPGTPGTPGSGAALNTFITAYQLTTGTAVDTVAPHGFILFPLVSPGFTIAPPIAGVFALPAGTYEVIYGAKWTATGDGPDADVAIALLLNGSVVSGSVLEPVSNDYTTVSVILNLATASNLAVQNQSATTDLTLGGAVAETGAFITIKRLS